MRVLNISDVKMNTIYKCGRIKRKYVKKKNIFLLLFYFYFMKTMNVFLSIPKKRCAINECNLNQHYKINKKKIYDCKIIFFTF